jgi:hypothetical protein
MKYIHKEKHHWSRRLIHLSIGIIPLIYYGVKDSISMLLHLSPSIWLTGILFLLLGLEAIRIKKRLLLYGQRTYERGTLSAMAWTGIGLILVLLLVPPYQGHEAAFALPIIWSLALGDPLIGECRQAHCATWFTICLTLSALTLIWLFAVHLFAIPYWLAVLMPCLAVFAEQIDIDQVDDNFTMVFVPLIFIKMFF